MKLVQINQQTCMQDGICADVCPARLIEFEKGDYPRPVPEAEEICIRCGHCVAVCPTGSLTHRDMDVDQCAPILKDLQITREQCDQFLRSRRSIRVYKDRPVPRDELARLIESARYAPTGHNSQCVEWSVLADRAELHRLAGIAVGWARWLIGNMPQVALSMHLDRTVKNWEAGRDVVLRGAPVLIAAHAEKGNPFAPTACNIALTYLELVAKGMGLGCCWAGYIQAAISVFPPMQEAFPVPEGQQVFGAMMVGYPKYGYHRIPTRKDPSIIWRM